MTTKKEYKEYFLKKIESSNRDSEVLSAYLDKQLKRFDELIGTIAKANFWIVFPEILGIDAKLTLLEELIRFEDFSTEELIRMVETDYCTYFKELCGYDLKTKPKPSLIFNVR
ncbi:DUF7006 family protein [Enterococcus sp. CR-Ec1]|uniref:DUF7006 family protein n=1 Tax=Enterococcus sp. CR-Ec1 TaxID=2057791 RepID=UPI000C75C3AF|nr:hypothetical protein [Enterococcus sp. CR-Ec1]AUJ87101.1 hypothetical protein CXM95_17295 [Enterococcus sp. CR-Ec1]